MRPPPARPPRAEDRGPLAPDPVRLAAFSILHRLELTHQSLDAPLRAAALSFSDRDRRFLWSLVQETVRWRSRLEAVTGIYLNRPFRGLDASVRVLLLLSAAQTCVLDQVPPHAIVDEAVRIARRFAPQGADRLVNAVSRRITEDARARWTAMEAEAANPDRWPVLLSHPRWLISRWRRRWGDERTRAMLEWDNSVAPVWLRVRPEAAALPPSGEPGWVPGTYRMPPGSRPFEDPGFVTGEWTAQDPGETLVGLLPPKDTAGMVLDLCAAPGTKSSHLADRYPHATVIAADARRSRAMRLRETRERTGAKFIIALADARSSPFRREFARGVLCDAPCSSLGVLRRRVDARWNVREADILRHGQKQIEILSAAATLVAPGGWLLYSVCSTEPEETDDVRGAFLGAHPPFREIPFAIDLPAWARQGPGTLRILPGEGDCDGVYACLFGRAEERT